MRKTLAALTAFACVAIAQPAQPAPEAQFEPVREGTAVPVTVYEADGTYSEWRWNYHQGAYYRSYTGTVDTDYSFGWSMFDWDPAGQSRQAEDLKWQW